MRTERERLEKKKTKGETRWNERVVREKQKYTKMKIKTNDFSMIEEAMVAPSKNDTWTETHHVYPLKSQRGAGKICIYKVNGKVECDKQSEKTEATRNDFFFSVLYSFQILECQSAVAARKSWGAFEKFEITLKHVNYLSK